MKVEGNYTFGAPRPMVFDMLQDPEVLAKIIPGCDELTKTGENEYEAALEINVGPIKGKFKGKVLLSNLVPPETYTLEVNGSGANGFLKGTGNVTLAEQDKSTLMSYQGDAQVGGKIASVGQRLVESAAKALIKQSLEGVNQHIQAVMDAKEKAIPVPPPVIQAPSQVEFATGVAKEIVSDLVPPNRRRSILIAAGVGAVVIFLLTRRRKKQAD